DDAGCSGTQDQGIRQTEPGVEGWQNVSVMTTEMQWCQTRQHDDILPGSIRACTQDGLPCAVGGEVRDFHTESRIDRERHAAEMAMELGHEISRSDLLLDRRAGRGVLHDRPQGARM